MQEWIGYRHGCGTPHRGWSCARIPVKSTRTATTEVRRRRSASYCAGAPPRALLSVAMQLATAQGCASFAAARPKVPRPVLDVAKQARFEIRSSGCAGHLKEVVADVQLLNPRELRHRYRAKMVLDAASGRWRPGCRRLEMNRVNTVFQPDTRLPPENRRRSQLQSRSLMVFALGNAFFLRVQLKKTIGDLGETWESRGDFDGAPKRRLPPIEYHDARNMYDDLGRRPFPRCARHGPRGPGSVRGGEEGGYCCTIAGKRRVEIEHVTSMVEPSPPYSSSVPVRGPRSRVEGVRVRFDYERRGTVSQAEPQAGTGRWPGAPQGHASEAGH